MKKLLSLVLTLAMLLVVTAPALAMTDDTLSTVPASGSDYYQLSVTLYTGNGNDFAPGGTMVLPTAQAANRAYVQNEIVYVGIKLAQTNTMTSSLYAKYAPKMFRITSTYDMTYDVNKAYVVNSDGKNAAALPGTAVLTDAVNSDGAYTTGVQDATAWLTDSTATEAGQLYAKGSALYIFGYFTNGKKDFAITAEFAPRFDLQEGAAGTIAGDELTTAGMYTYKVDAHTFIVYSDDCTIQFSTDDTNRVKDMKVAFAKNTAPASTLEYDQVYSNVTSGHVVDWNVNHELANSAQKASISAIFKALAFDISKQNTGAVREGHFVVKLAGTRLAASSKGSFYNPVITVPGNPVVTPPKTGDQATAAGFVMLAAAVIAVLGVAYKKVRG